MATISDQLRKAIKAAGENGISAYRIAKDAGIDPGLLSRFLSGERDLRLETVDKIVAALGVKVSFRRGKKE